MGPGDSSSSFTLSARQVSSSNNFPAVAFWDAQWQTRFLSVIDSSGDYQGSCTLSTENIPLLLDDNLCASWIPDITLYCCAAVGGILESAETAATMATNGSDELGQNNTSVFEPVCLTSNFNDMLDCYKVTTDSDCRSADVAPYGICDPRTADTSRRRNGSSSGAQSRSLSSVSHLVILAVLASSLLL